MQELFIPYDGKPILADLTTSFQALCASRDAIAAFLAAFKTRRGERLLKGYKRTMEDKFFRERERAYEVAALRLELAVGELKTNSRALFNACEAVRKALAEQKSYEQIDFGVEMGVAQNNVLCAVDLIDKALALHHEVVSNQLRPFRWHYFGIENSFKAVDESDDPREFVVMAGAHGSKQRFEEGDGTTPPAGPYLTLSEAKAEASHWVGYADTVGGDASVYNVRTKQIVSWR
ncbi:MAG: hypothetical protein WCT03_09530 [Candidatus Obscuribacterales bacterium]|jgi:hypothetical protein